MGATAMPTGTLTATPPGACFFDQRGELSLATSHPVFVALAPQALLDEGDDFAPFGNDDGLDALRLLEGFYAEGGSDCEALDFACELEAEWAHPVPPEIWSAVPVDVLAWLADDPTNDGWLAGVARARVALALGQLKIRGLVAADLATRAKVGLMAQYLLLEHAETAYPDWPWQAHAKGALAATAAVLAQAPDSAGPVG